MWTDFNRNVPPSPVALDIFFVLFCSGHVPVCWCVGCWVDLTQSLCLFIPLQKVGTTSDQHTLISLDGFCTCTVRVTMNSNNTKFHGTNWVDAVMNICGAVLTRQRWVDRFTKYSKLKIFRNFQLRSFARECECVQSVKIIRVCVCDELTEKIKKKKDFYFSSPNKPKHTHITHVC